MTDSVDPNATNNIASTFLPRIYRTDANTKFLQATVEQLSQQGTVTRLNGYIGRQSAKATSGNDIFIKSPDKDRQNYQLEPSIVINDQEGNNSYFKDYIDYINRIKLYGGNVSNHNRLNSEEFYSWDPRIDWDKFVNFQNYYWIKPNPITINGQQQSIISAYNVKTTTIGNTTQYVFTPNGLTEDPLITLYRGQTYRFNIDAVGNPFSIKTERSLDVSARYDIPGITGYAIETGIIEFTVPDTAPDILFYQSETELNAGGIFKIETIAENTFINVEEDIIGKSSYTLPNGVSLSNGMLVNFSGNISPSIYGSKNYFVEGVGNFIKLLPEEIYGQTSTPDYIVINRASSDKNQWSRNNLWVSLDVIETSNTYSSVSTPVSIDQALRAVRPIIEFSENLKLFNHGTDWLMDIDFIDEYTVDGLSLIEGSEGYYIDNTQISENQLIILVNEYDQNVKNNIYKVVYVNSKIHLELIAKPTLNQVIFVKQGLKNKLKYYWFDGNSWVLAQQKNTVNQPPMFDVVDENAVSFGDNSVYNGTTFTGTSVFSYKVGSGTADTILNFPLSYRNINNIGDIVFNFNFVNDTFSYKKNSLIVTEQISTGYLTYKTEIGENVYSNGWVKANTYNTQAGVRIYKNSGLLNNFNIDIFDDITNLSDLIVKVYLNGTRIQQYTTANPNWVIVDTLKYKQIVLLSTNTEYYATKTDQYTNLISTDDTTTLQIGQQLIFSNDIGNLRENKSYYITSIPSVTTFTVSTIVDGPNVELSMETNKIKFYIASDISLDDILSIRTLSSQSINENGYYEIPNNLQNNPLNGDIKDFTLGEVINHVDSIVDNLSSLFVGSFPGRSNLRDISNLSSYGTKFIKHSGPASISMYHLTSSTASIVEAIEKSRDDYNKFKRKFISVAESLGIDTDTKTHVDLILQSITKNISNTSSYYFSDMVPFGASIKTVFKIEGFITNQFPLQNPYDMTVLSNKAVGVYLNGNQLMIEHDYTFNSQGYIDISVTLNQNDEIEIYEYENTDGCFVPETPSKLGIWPVYDPKLYKDTTLITPQWVIQGHDGSQVLAYGNYDDGYSDYRDDLILELEKRIYNNIKIKYDPEIFDVLDIIPSYNRHSEYTLEEFNKVLAPSFYKWTSLIDVDYSENIGFDTNNPFTFNYTSNYSISGGNIPGYWRGIYKWMLDTDRPSLCPWEILGQMDKPEWWDTVYGLPPYTSDNLIMWDDISQGILNQPGNPQILSKYKKPFLINHIPVDEYGNLLNPNDCGLVQGSITSTISNKFIFGDCGPVESAWRRSSHYSFSVILASILLHPSKTFGVILDRSRISRNITGQLVYDTSGLHINPKNIKIPSIYSSSYRSQTSGLINYVINYIIGDNLTLYNKYSYDLSNMSYVLSYRISGFTSKNQFNLLLDSKSPLTKGNVFVPQDDYNIILNTSSPTNKITYSGVIVTKMYDGYSVKGYSRTQPYFTYYNWTQSGSTINVGGISDSFVNWTSGKSYNKGQIVKFGSEYYTATVYINNDISFDDKKYMHLSSLPIVGGRTAVLRKVWDKSSPITIPYNTKFNTVQEVVDFLIGYGEWLKDQGFIFDEFNTNLNHVLNWETSAKEFMFWTTQNWSAGQDTWDDWKPNTLITFNSVIKYEGNYYRAMRNVQPSSSFEYDYFEKMNGLSDIGSSVISLSPAANSITFSTPYNVVDDITNQFNDYEILRVDGQAISPLSISSNRNKNLITYKPTNDDGIYNASFYTVQKEHVVLINNVTMFNDLIYDPTSGYKQDRIKVTSYVSSGWYGGFDIPGFVFDEASITKWVPWKDYSLGEVVQYQSFYYSAKMFINGTQEFSSSDWVRLNSKPTPKLLPNWTNLATQFTDFYSLDDNHFDTAQQTMAQHLIGYQKRQYLENIIKDDVSEFKFYQGMITEKGTQNVFNKLFGVLSTSQDSLTFYEEWAIRVGQYGNSSSFDEVEFVLNEEKFKTNPQVFELVDNKTKDSGYVIQQQPVDVYVKPIDYTSNLWPIVTSNKTILRSGGYVRSDDVLMTLGYISEIIGQDVSKFTDGDYVWCTFHDISWNVFRYTLTNLIVTNITYNNKLLTLYVNNNANINENDYISITNISNISGFFKVNSFSSNTLILDASHITFKQPESISEIKIYQLTTQRANSIDNATNILHYPLKSNELLWTDNAGDNKWASWVYNSVYTGSIIPNPNNTSNNNYGRSIASDSSGRFVSIASSSGEVYIYRNTNTNTRRLHQVITKPFISLDDQNSIDAFGRVVAMSLDGKWLAIGSPNISNACTENNNIDISWDSTVKINNTGITFDRNLQSIVAGDFVIGYTYTITSVGSTDFTQIGADSNTIGVIFIATGVGAGTGTAVNTSPVQAGNFVIGYTYTISSIGNTNFVQVGAKRNQVGVVFVATGVGSGTGTAVKNVISSTANVNFTSINGYNSPFTNQGVVSLYTQDQNENYYLVGTIVSPKPMSNQFFGSTLEFGLDTLYIGASDNQYIGSVYKINYNMIINARAMYDAFNSTGITVNLLNSPGINVFDMHVIGTGFDGTQKVVNYDLKTPTKITLNTNPNTQPSGILSFVSFEWQYDMLSTMIGENANDNFGVRIKSSADDSTLVISSLGKSYVYKNGTLLQIITGDTYAFGVGVDVSNKGEFIAISDSLYTNRFSNQGIVKVYSQVSGSSLYTEYQTIENLYNSAHAEFGYNISFMDNYDTLVIHSRYANSPSSYVDIYDRYASKWVFSERLPLLSFNVNELIIGTTYTITSLGTTTNAQWNIIAGTSNIQYSIGTTFIASQTGGNFGTGAVVIDLENDINNPVSFVVASFSILIGTPYEGVQNSGIVFEYKKPSDIYSWTIKNKEIDKPDISKIKKVFLYNKNTNELVTYLDVIDPLQGKIAGIAEQELSYKTLFDPAIYSVGDQTVNVDTGMAWTTEQVGKLWWDLRTTKFIESYQNDSVYRESTWNTLVYGASVDIYEWVETKLLPDEWDAQADTDAGLALGISGTSLYGSNCYSKKTYYDNVSKVLKNTYYYWVKNKAIVPAISGRHTSAQSISSLIARPLKNAYKYISFTSSNTFHLSNVGQTLENSDIILSIQYWLLDDYDGNTHAQWKIVSNEPSTVLPDHIEQKWFDSLCGMDMLGRIVPDVNLPLKLKYGVENRPRQGMFVNRFEAIKQYVEQVNNVLIRNQIANIRDLSALEKYDEYPLKSSGLYDYQIDTDLELQFVNNSIFKLASLTPVIEDGKIVSVTITNSGLGYINPPSIEILGIGTNAILQSSINSKGQIESVNVVNSGEGYDINTELVVRSFTVLVLSDTTSNNKWALYSYDVSSRIWNRTLIQAYDNRVYWDFVDWYVTGYNQFTAISHSVNIFSDLQELNTNIGDIIKVRYGNGSKWVLIIKNNSIESLDWTRTYSIIGIQEGTIQLKSSLYNSTSAQYDGTLYDVIGYDNSANAELRNILTAIRDNILINELKSEYLDLFFNSVRYAFNEQNYIDWIFKTSFVKATHNAGSLNQPVAFKNDNLNDYENYVSEVKPYRTKVREYVSTYDNLDTGMVSLSDFDLPPIYVNGGTNAIEAQIVDNKVVSYNTEIKTYPWKSWYNNVGFSVISANIILSGDGYDVNNPPTITIISDSGMGATAHAIVDPLIGSISSIVIDNSGSGYLTSPTILISSPTYGQTAVAKAIIGGGLVRSNIINIKFDRITKNYFINKLQENEVFNATTDQKVFELIWAPDIKIGSSIVKLNGKKITTDLYKLELVTLNQTGNKTSYKKLYGQLVFDDKISVVDGDIIDITYNKDVSILSAADRINFFYTSTTNDLGSDLSQLMAGIDYAGVIIDGVSFDINKGWDSLPFLSDRWDSYDPTFTDYTVKATANQHSFTLPYLPVDGTVINVYCNNVRIDDINFQTVLQTNSSAVMISPVIGTTSDVISVGNDGSITINIPSFFKVKRNDIFIFRESTSDGSIKTLRDDYDTSYDGGNLIYTTATGYLPADLIVDGGDKFVTPLTSHAPEEVIPGQIVDTLSIKVFEQSDVVSGNIKVTKFIADGSNTKFNIGQRLNNIKSVIVVVKTFIKSGDTLAYESRIKELGVDYTINYKNNLVVFNNAPSAGSEVSLFSIGVNSTNVVDIDYIVADGNSVNYSTKTVWNSNYLVDAYVDGVKVGYTIKNINEACTIVFSTPPDFGSLISYIVVNTVVRTFTITSNEQILIPQNGLAQNQRINISSVVGSANNNENNMIVIIDQQVLTPSMYTYYPANGGVPGISFNIGLTSSNIVNIISSYNNSILEVERSGKTVSNIVYTVDTPQYYNELSVFGGVIQLPKKVKDENYIWVIKNGVVLIPGVDFVLNDDRTSITLELEPEVSDVFDFITYNSNTTNNLAYMQFKDMLNRTFYKDINTSKQTFLDNDLLQTDLFITVKDISIFDIPNPSKNIPGVVEIGTERIEYFEIKGNTLGQLRRATLGTGSKIKYDAGTIVQNIGPSSNIAYNDRTISYNINVTQEMINNDNRINIDFIPSVTRSGTFQIGRSYIIKTIGVTPTDFTLIGAENNNIGTTFVATGIGSGDGTACLVWEYDNQFVSTIPSGYGQCDDIEVFIGGYDIKTWNANTTYTNGDIVIYGTYAYKCTINHISGKTFNDVVSTVVINDDKTTTVINTGISSDMVWRFFDTSVRLKKEPYKLFNVNKSPYSPAGDIQFDADYSVDGVSKYIRLTNPVPIGTTIIVVKKYGSVWDNKYAIL